MNVCTLFIYWHQHDILNNHLNLDDMLVVTTLAIRFYYLLLCYYILLYFHHFVCLFFIFMLFHACYVQCCVVWMFLLIIIEKCVTTKRFIGYNHNNNENHPHWALYAILTNQIIFTSNQHINKQTKTRTQTHTTHKRTVAHQHHGMTMNPHRQLEEVKYTRF